MCDQLFKGKKDRYNGITVTSTDECRSEELFPKSLEDSLEKWKTDGTRAVWFKVYLEHSHWIPVLAKNSFKYHHAKTNYVSMVRWLPANETSAVPCYGHTTIGAGAFVLNDKDEVLVVRETAYSYPHWKLPGGYVEPGEDISAAAQREVEEETGIATEFVSLIGFNHSHKLAFDCSNIYFVVCLKAKSSEIKLCQQEIAACQWMKLEEYRHHELVHDTNKLFAEQFIQCRERGVDIKSKDKLLVIPSISINQKIFYIDYKDSKL